MIAEGKLCDCGCGKYVPGNNPRKRFFNTIHYKAWYAEQRRVERKELGARRGNRAIPYDIGDVFRNWTITGEGITYDKVEVRCSCGWEGVRFLSHVRNGKSNTCAKCRSRGNLKYEPLELKESYGFLTVIKQQLGAKSSPNIYVRCTCGVQFWAAYTSLDYGRTTSCGCRGKDVAMTVVKPHSTIEKVSICGRIYTLEVETSKAQQPRTEANMMRTSGQCNRDGLCSYYTKCGDAMFEGKCHGYQQPKDEYYTNGNGTVIHTAVY